MKCYSYIVIVLVLAVLFSCDVNRFDTMGLQRATALIIGDSLKMVRWKLVQTYDPYAGGRITKMDSENPRMLEIYSNGKFKMYESDLIGKGKWYLKSDKSAIAFIYDDQSSEVRTNPDKDIIFTHQVRKLSKDTMILAWQGRHGFIEELYVAQRATSKGILPTRIVPADISVATDSAR